MNIQELTYLLMCVDISSFKISNTISLQYTKMQTFHIFSLVLIFIKMSHCLFSQYLKIIKSLMD